jgi:hypothetical protein
VLAQFAGSPSKIFSGRAALALERFHGGCANLAFQVARERVRLPPCLECVAYFSQRVAPERLAPTAVGWSCGRSNCPTSSLYCMRLR